ncbi:MAG: hypothetical protein RLZZ609_22 [Cyanobacteriota bacterium]|jgi:hypothetical protein
MEGATPCGTQELEICVTQMTHGALEWAFTFLPERFGSKDLDVVAVGYCPGMQCDEQSFE